MSVRLSMFGLRWITATALRWHSRPDCGALKNARRHGWTPFPITAGYGRDFYEPCQRCAQEANDA